MEYYVAVHIGILRSGYTTLLYLRFNSLFQYDSHEVAMFESSAPRRNVTHGSSRVNLDKISSYWQFGTLDNSDSLYSNGDELSVVDCSRSLLL